MTFDRFTDPQLQALYRVAKTRLRPFFCRPQAMMALREAYIDRKTLNQWRPTMKINVKDYQKIKLALDKVNGKAEAHTITRPVEVESCAYTAEQRLEKKGVLKKHRPGSRYVYRPEGPGKAYARKSRYFITTTVYLERGASGWFLTGAVRGEHWSDGAGIDNLWVSQDAHDDIATQALKGVLLMQKEED